jgi:transposase
MAVSTEKRAILVRLHKNGMSLSKIALTVGVCRSTVVKLLNRYRETGNLTPGKHPGRPRVLSGRDERELVRIMRKAPTTRPSTLKTSLLRTGHPKISTDTVRRTLHRAGLVAAKMRRKPRLKPEQRKARLEWAKKYAQMPAEFWDSVIFSDESSFHVHESMRGKYTWRFKNEELEPRFVQETVKFGGSKTPGLGLPDCEGGWLGLRSPKRP